MKERAANNRTLTLSEEEKELYRKRLVTENNISQNSDIINKTLNGDVLAMLKHVPDEFADLIENRYSDEDNDYPEQVIKYGIYDEVNRILTKVREVFLIPSNVPDQIS